MRRHVSALLLAGTVVLSACATTGAGVPPGTPALVPLPVHSNEPCRFLVDGQQAGAGRDLVLHVTEEPHAVTCVAEGYKPKTEYANPPARSWGAAFFFMVGDRSNAGPTWEEIHEQQRVSAAAGARRFANGGELGAAVGLAFSGPAGQRVVAVTGLVHRETGKATRLSARLQDDLIAGLIAAGARVVKRERIDLLVSEMRLQEEAGAVDPATMVKLGKIAGAKALVTGTYVDAPGEGVVRVKLELTDVETAIIEKAFSGELLRSTEVLRLVEP
jgi:hypothetical protein